MAVCKRLVHLGIDSAICLSKFESSTAPKLYGTATTTRNSGVNRFDYRRISQVVNLNGSRAFLVDTLALVRRLEAQGVPSKQAEAITAAITEVLNDSLENVSHAFVSRADAQKSDMVQEANLSKFRAEIQSSQDHHFSLLQRETEKLQNDIGKIRRELKYEVDKVTAGKHLDLNLERGLLEGWIKCNRAFPLESDHILLWAIHDLRGVSGFISPRTSCYSFGAYMSGQKLLTSWAVDINSYACESLKKNHPETKVRNEAADNFLCLLKEWQKLCSELGLLGSEHNEDESPEAINSYNDADEVGNESYKIAPDEFEVQKLLDVCYGDPNKVKKLGLYFKVLRSDL